VYITNTTINVKYLTTVPRGVDYEDNQETDFGTVYKRVLINVKFKTGKSGQTRELTGRRP
jgi:hypothetical protein